MNNPLLSILIPTVFEREDLCNLLLQKLGSQILNLNGTDKIMVSVMREVDNKEMSIGEKREKLYQKATGLFSWQIDDDDDIAEGSIEKILEAIKNNPDVDCITFREKCIIDGVYKRSNFSHKYDGWKDNFDGFDWVRDVFYKCVIKTEIAKKVPFPHIRYNEDQQWGVALKPFIHTEHHIDEEIYYYIHNSSPLHERYGFDKDIS